MNRLLALAALLAATALPGRAATYYVATTGNDAAAGSIGAPYKTIRKGLSALQAGDTLYIRGGTYAESIADGIASGSSWSAPTTVAGYPGETVTLAPAAGAARVITMSNGHYIVFQNLILDATHVTYDAVKITFSGANTAHHIRIQDSEIKNSPWEGVLTGETSPGNEFIRDKVHDNGTTDLNHGFYIDGDSNIIDHCDIYRNAGWGIHVFNGYTGSGHHSSNNVVRFCKVHDNARLGKRGAGIIICSGVGNSAYNNLVWNNAGGIQVDYGAQNTKILNNTIYNNNHTSSWGIYVGNNPSDGGLSSFGAVVQNNITYLNNGGGVVNVQSGTTITNNLTTNPLFAAAASLNFGLTAGSPAIDAGVNVAAQGVTTDYNGTPRPQGRAFDIGAYEYPSGGGGSSGGTGGGGGVAPTPAPPPRVTIVPVSPPTTIVPAPSGAVTAPTGVAQGTGAAGCVTAGAAWRNEPFSPKTGTFTAKFDASPSTAKMDGVIGLANGPAGSYASVAAAVRFNNAGRLDARNGGAYSAAVAIAYAPGVVYHFRLVVNVKARTYSAYVRAGAGAEQALGLNYAFRAEQRSVTVLNDAAMFASSGSVAVCALSAQ